MNTVLLRRLISWDTLKYWADTKNLRQHEDKVLLMLTLLIGATVGLVVVAFIVLTENLGSRMYPEGGAAWRRIVVPVLGALITGYLLKRYFPNARGSGIPQTKTALFLHEGVIRLRTVLGKFGCSSVSLASGIALGREGPSVQVGAGIASILGRQLGLSPETIKATGAHWLSRGAGCGLQHADCGSPVHSGRGHGRPPRTRARARSS